VLPPIRVSLTLADLWSSATRGDPAAPERLEEAFAARFGFPHAILFPYARSALCAMVKAFGWHGRKIACPAYTCAVVPLTAAASGNTPMLADSAPDHFLPGSEQWAAAIAPETAMMIVTPLYGYPVDKSCEEHARRRAPGIFVLYDEAQSCGVTDDAGFQSRDADGALFSLGTGKMLSALSGGMILLRGSDAYREVRRLRDTRYTRPSLIHTLKLAMRGLAAWAALREPMFSVLCALGQAIPKMSFDRIGDRELLLADLPSDAETLASAYQANIGLRMLGRLGALLQGGRKLGEYYDRRLRKEGFRTFPHHASPIFTRYPLAVANRTGVLAAAAAEGIHLGRYVSYSSANAPSLGSDSRSYPNAELWGRCMINLPNWNGLEIRDAERCVSLLLKLATTVPEAVAWPKEAK